MSNSGDRIPSSPITEKVSPLSVPVFSFDYVLAVARRQGTKTVK